MDPPTHRVRIAPALGVLLFFLGLYGLTSHSYVDNEDVEVAYQATRSLVEEGHLAIPDTPEGDLIKERGFFVVQADDGQHYPIYPIAQILYQAPFYLLGRELAPLAETRPEHVVRLVFTSVNALAGAFLCMVICLLTQALGYSARVSVITAWLGGAGTMLWAYAQGGFADLPMSLCVALSALCIARRRTPGIILAGFVLGLAIAIRPPAVLMAAPWLWYLRRRGVRSWIAFGLPIAAVIAGMLYVDHAVLGRPLEGSYAGKAQLDPPIWTESYTLALHGMLLSDGRGLFLLSPVLALAVLSLPAWARRGDGSTTLVFGPVVILTLWFAAFSGWYGGACWGTRYVLPAVPLLAVGMAPWLAQARLPARVLAIALALLSLWIQALSVAVPHRMYYTFTTSSDHDVTSYFFYPKYSPVLAHQRILIRKLRGEPDRFSENWLFGTDTLSNEERDLTAPISTGISFYNRGFDHFAVVRILQKQRYPIAIATITACVLALGAGLWIGLRGSNPHPLPIATRTPKSADNT